MQKLIGFTQKKGNFTNKDTGELVEYDNTELYLLTDEKEGVTGLMPIVARAKSDQLKIINAKNLDEAINKEVYAIVDMTNKTDENGRTRMLVSKLVVVG